MRLETYRRKPVGRRKGELVQAIQVQRPLRAVTYAFPRTRQRTKASGALDYLRVIDAPEGRNRAKEGDWIVKTQTGVEVVSKEEFATGYELHNGTTQVGTQDQTGDALDATAET